MEEDRDGRRRTNGAFTGEHVRAALERCRGAPEVCFTSGEPTLVEELPQYAGWARALDYPRVSVATNGRRLAYRSYAATLISAGINLFYVSVHGHLAALHDGLSRTRGAFAQTVAGLNNLAQLKRTSIPVHTCTVVTKHNVASVTDIYTFLRGLGADQVIFNVMQANGRAHRFFDLLFPRYTEIVDSFAGLLATLDESNPPVFLVDVPPCMTTGLPRFNRGWVESYVHHEAVADGHTHRADGPLPTPQPIGDAQLIEHRRSDLDRERRVHGPACRDCGQRPSCAGVWGNYVARFGWDEFQPISPVDDPDRRGRR
jgi:cyclic pyranopterin phosphate synthase